MKRDMRFVYFLCVGAMIALVVFGWIYTTRESFVDKGSAAKKDLTDAVISAKEEFEETKQIREDAKLKLEQTKKAASSISGFIEKKEDVSKSIIESLKQHIEEKDYVQASEEKKVE